MISMQMTCSACPTQFSGTIAGFPAYFRARWNWWRLTVATVDPVMPKQEDIVYLDEGQIGEDGDDMLGIMEPERCMEVFQRADAALTKASEDAYKGGDLPPLLPGPKSQ